MKISFRMLQAIWMWWQTRSPISTDKCVGCGSRRLKRESGEDNYTCLACGYVRDQDETNEQRREKIRAQAQGPGLRAANRKDLNIHAPQIPEEAVQSKGGQLAYAFRELENAKLVLIAVRTTFESANWAALRDLVNLERVGDHSVHAQKHRNLAEALSQVYLANEHMQNARAMLVLAKGEEFLGMLPEELILWEADIFMDGIAVDAVMLVRVRHADKQSEKMLASVERLIDLHFPPDVQAEMEAARERERLVAIEHPRPCDRCGEIYDESDLNLGGYIALCNLCEFKDQEQSVDSIFAHGRWLVIAFIFVFLGGWILLESSPQFGRYGVAIFGCILQGIALLSVARSAWLIRKENKVRALDEGGAPSRTLRKLLLALATLLSLAVVAGFVYRHFLL